VHEISLVEAIVRDISDLAQRENFHRVIRIQLEIGALSGVVRDSIEFCFPSLSDKTPLEGASLNFKSTPLTIRCGDCSQESSPAIDDMKCSHCDSRNFTVIAGKDFKIVDIEVE
jgi:hydrogenase nickel incorporation protein HypA/HybF